MKKEGINIETGITAKADTKPVDDSLPMIEEDIWDKIDWDMQQWGMGQGECESLINEWKHRYKIALRN